MGYLENVENQAFFAVRRFGLLANKKRFGKCWNGGAFWVSALKTLEWPKVFGAFARKCWNGAGFGGFLRGLRGLRSFTGRDEIGPTRWVSAFRCGGFFFLS